ncbi:MAG: 5-methyltetrahydropteroyltriglutamate--homocysteine S-methyltransferase [Alphaproteobacteria bacterium]|nr:MAG: 5-methyltetrahydropteroyltriglutamate--homocysteine S-methyltransferase [Alphaproteobacteria bacterium]
MPDTSPPFRADHVGSLLRPQALIDARDRLKQGAIGADELWEIESEAVRDAIALQEGAGLKSITDGDFRRGHWWNDFVLAIDGIEIQGGMAVHFRQKPGEEIAHAPHRAVVTGRLHRPRGICTDAFRFLKENTSQTPKICIPSPSIVHFRSGREGIDRKAYPDMAEFFHDLARIWREEIADIAALGGRYIQLDEVNLAFLCDPKLRDAVRRLGEDPDTLPETYAGLINETLAGRPHDMVACLHLCRGNHRSNWVAEGGFEPVAEILFNEIDVDAYFLEFDSPRAGNFEPLRFVPKGKTIVLGIVTSKFPDLESKDDLKRRVEEASKYLPLDQLALSPQCGFASTLLGNKLTVEDEKAKLRLVVETAQEIWG